MMSGSMHEKIYRAFNADIEGFDPTSLDALKDRLHALGPLTQVDLDGLASYDAAFLVRYAYESNAIEGSTLTLAETDLVLEGEFNPTGDKRLSEIFAARGIVDGHEYAKKALSEHRSVTQDFIKDLHERTALDCQPRVRGVYRLSAVYIRGSLTVPPDAVEVRELMESLVYAWASSAAHPIAKAAAFHAMLENIHPFQDGNGRTGRLLMNYMLEQAGFPPIAIKHDEPLDYKTSLEDWQVRCNPQAFLDLVALCVERELFERIRIIESSRLLQ